MTFGVLGLKEGGPPELPCGKEETREEGREGGKDINGKSQEKSVVHEKSTIPRSSLIVGWELLKCMIFISLWYLFSG